MEPITRKEMFMAKAAGQSVNVPEPITREEKYLAAIAASGGGGGGKVTLYMEWPYLNKSEDLGESTRPSKAEVFEYAKNGGFVIAEPGGSAYYFPVSVGVGGENEDRAVVTVNDGDTFKLYSKEYVPEGGGEN